MKPIALLSCAVLGVAASMVPTVARADADLVFDVTTTADTVDADPGDGSCVDEAGACSLRAAVQEANAHGGFTRINMAKGKYLMTQRSVPDDPIDGAAASGDLDIVRGTVAIYGNRSTIDLRTDFFDTSDRAFDVATGATLEIRALMIENGELLPGESGGAIRSAGSLRFLRSDATNNEVSGAGGHGGAIANVGGFLDVRRSSFVSNASRSAGGAISSSGTSAIEVHNSNFVTNLAGDTLGFGGAIHLAAGSAATITGSNFDRNYASEQGAALWNSAESSMHIARGTFIGNRVNGSGDVSGGGAIFNQGPAGAEGGGRLAVDSSTFVANYVVGPSASGGAILNDHGLVTVTASVFDTNTADRAGGAIETFGGEVDLSFVTIRRNATGTSPGNGGAIHLTGAATVRIVRSDVSFNDAEHQGGGIWNSATGSVSIEHSSIRGNTAIGDGRDVGGGGIYNQGDGEGSSGTVVVDDSTLTANLASGPGAGILNDEGSIVIDDSTISNNRTFSAPGGGIATIDGSVMISRSTLFDNQAERGGAIYTEQFSSVTITDSTVTSNAAFFEGGGLWNSKRGTMVVSATVVADNTNIDRGSADRGPNVFQKGRILGGSFTVDGQRVPAGSNTLEFR